MTATTRETDRSASRQTHVEADRQTNGINFAVMAAALVVLILLFGCTCSDLSLLCVFVCDVALSACPPSGTRSYATRSGELCGGGLADAVNAA